MREPSHRLTQHKRRGGRSLLVLWDPEEAPTLFFKGSKPGAATAGWGLFFAGLVRQDVWGEISHSARHTCAETHHPRGHGQRALSSALSWRRDPHLASHRYTTGGGWTRSVDCRVGSPAARGGCAPAAARVCRVRGRSRAASGAARYTRCIGGSMRLVILCSEYTAGGRQQPWRPGTARS